MITLDDIKKAQKTIEIVVSHTPLTYAPILSKISKSKIYLKKENLQITGSFKIRGSFNKIAQLSQKEKTKGIVTASAGNHAQGVGFSANYFKMNAIIVMPESTPLTKINGVLDHGAEVILKGNNYDESYEFAQNLAIEKNMTFIHPFNDDDVIAGQGTLALEILEEQKDIEVFVVPIGGGGLISGVAVAAKSINPDIKIIGVVASGADAMKQSYIANKVINTKSVKTIADGIAVRDTDAKMLKYNLKYVDEIVEVNDNEIANAILFLLEKQKLVVEGAGAVATAALIHGKIAKIKDKKVAVMISGGNIDVTILSVIIEKGLIKSNRKTNLLITLIDKPGSLTKLTKIFKDLFANIVFIDYDRNSVKLDFGDANVTISVETKGEKHKQDILNKLEQSGFSYKEL